MFGTMVDYWAYTGDETYLNVTYQALQSQIGDDADFMPTNQTKTEGNDEYVVPPPPPPKFHQAAALSLSQEG